MLLYPWSDPPEPGVPREVAPGVEWVRLPLPMALDHVNCWLLADVDADGDGVAIVDTGLDTRHTRALWETALAGRRVTRIIVTHHHPDHVGLAGRFRAEGAALHMPRTGWLMARMLQLDVQARPSPEAEAFWRGAGMEPELLARRMAERPFNFADVTAPLPLGFTRLAEGGRLRLAGRDWVVRMGAGHAPEHATLWSEAGDLVIGGDQLLPSISPNLGVYPTEPEADPVAEWLAACDRLAVHATPEQLVLPGHKLPYRGLPLRLRQLAENHHGALARLEAHLARPRTATECFAPLFRRRIGEAEYGLALVEAMAHCLHLWHACRAARSRRADGAWLWRAAGADAPVSAPAAGVARDGC